MADNDFSICKSSRKFMENTASVSMMTKGIPNPQKLQHNYRTQTTATQ
jgi:hypothetical protein